MQTIKNFRNQKSIKQLFDTRNLGLYLFAVIVLAISWSTVKAIQQNYELQKKIAVIKQQNEVLQLQNDTTQLKNKYLATDQYLELAARQNLGLAAPGEKVLLIPRQVALAHVDKKFFIQAETENSKPVNTSKATQNFQDWREFLLGHKLFQD